jgi:hypothetical protein
MKKPPWNEAFCNFRLFVCYIGATKTKDMDIKIIEVPTPMFSEFTMYANIDIDKLKKEKTVRVRPHNETKTRISTSLQIGQSRNKINFAIEGFKTFEKTSFSYLSGNSETSHFFVKSKKQDLEAYKEYVKKVVEKALTEYIGVELDEVTIELESQKF